MMKCTIGVANVDEEGELIPEILITPDSEEEDNLIELIAGIKKFKLTLSCGWNWVSADRVQREPPQLPEGK